MGLGDFDGVWISGSPHNVYALDQPSVREQIAFARAIWDAGIPAFGSCWGLQVMSAALGGEAIREMMAALPWPVQCLAVPHAI